MSFEINFCLNFSCFGVILFGHQAVIMRPESAVLNHGEEYRNTCPAYGIFKFGLKQHKLVTARIFSIISSTK
jgi:hypothetical protein